MGLVAYIVTEYSFVGDHGLSPAGETHRDSPYRARRSVTDRLALVR